LRKLTISNNQIKTPTGIPFKTPNDSSLNNILFTSQWDNFPDSATVSLSGKAFRFYLLMACPINPMQSRMVNGQILINYKDGTTGILQLRNPENRWTFEQDYIIDGYAFITGAAFPLQLYLKEGKFAYGLKKYSSIKGLTDMAIVGGAATVLDMPLDASNGLKLLTLKALANDVVIRLMGAILQRK
jgi:hypothetical protein